MRRYRKHKFQDFFTICIHSFKIICIHIYYLLTQLIPKNPKENIFPKPCQRIEFIEELVLKLNKYINNHTYVENQI